MENYSRITLNGVEYYLVPVEEPKRGVIDDYSTAEVSRVVEKTAEGGVKKAVPVLSDYRERFKSRSLVPEDVTAFPKRQKLIQPASSEIDAVNKQVAGIMGEDAFFGPGLEYDL